MPCYMVVLTNVKISMKNADILEEYLKSTGEIVYKDYDTNGELRGLQVGRIKFNLKTQEARVPQDQLGKLNEIKRGYSQMVVEKVAKKRKWIVKHIAKQKMQLKKY